MGERQLICGSLQLGVVPTEDTTVGTLPRRDLLDFVCRVGAQSAEISPQSDITCLAVRLL